MAETRITYLKNAASCLLKLGNSRTQTFIRSYYLMKCRQISKSIGLPDKYISSTVRCSYCCIEWDKEVKTKIKSTKLSKKQRRHLRKKAIKNNSSDTIHMKELERICSFCMHKNITPIARLQREKEIKIKSLTNKTTKGEGNVNKSITNNQKCTQTKNTKDIDVYANAKEIFSLKNKKNIIPSTVDEPVKVIKNNKKKKDKFAGLCQKAVLASAKLKQEQLKQNKLNLFLKPSTS